MKLKKFGNYYFGYLKHMTNLAHNPIQWETQIQIITEDILYLH